MTAGVIDVPGKAIWQSFNNKTGALEGSSCCHSPKAPWIWESAHTNPVTHKINLRDCEKRNWRQCWPVKPGAWAQWRPQFLTFFFNVEPQRTSLLRIRTHRAEQSQRKKWYQLHQLKDIFILKKFFNLITAAFLCVLNGRLLKRKLT